MVPSSKWLHCLEKSRCASPETGWGPQHVSVKLNGKVVAYVPLYLKGHSMVSSVLSSIIQCLCFITVFLSQTSKRNKNMKLIGRVYI